jgi:hypothetical protein
MHRWVVTLTWGHVQWPARSVAVAAAYTHALSPGDCLALLFRSWTASISSPSSLSSPSSTACLAPCCLRVGVGSAGLLVCARMGGSGCCEHTPS